MSTLALPSLSSSCFKSSERKCGQALERVVRESCAANTQKEKSLSRDNEDNDVVDVGVSYDMEWRKRGKRYDSSSGVGTAVGVKTGKVLSYSTRNTMCRVCEVAQRAGEEAAPHDCRKNHEGSSKSMESSVAVELFKDAVKDGIRYSTYIGDDDSTTESHLKTLVTYDIEKWSDVNHSSRTLGSRLYACKGNVKGLNPVVIAYIQKCFTYCIKQNQNDPTSLLKQLKSIVPHAFGEHQACGDWCQYNADPQSYSHSDLPGGKDLTGENLRASIEDALSPFLTEEAAKKLAPAGSSQRNECLNGIISSKAPKARHYGDLESANFRTAAGIAQFNEGYGYITAVTNDLGICSSTITTKYSEVMENKKIRDSKRKAQRVFKKNRRNRKKRRMQKTQSLEAHEGVSYESGVGIHMRMEVTNGTINDLKTSLTREEFHQFSDHVNESSIQTSATVSPSATPHNVMFFDLETTGLERKSDILHIACIQPDGGTTFERFLLPDTRRIADSATRVHGISVQYRNGSRVICKNGKDLVAVSQCQGLTEFVGFMETFLRENAGGVLLIAHNGDQFDFQILVNALLRYNLWGSFSRLGVVFMDSLTIIAQEIKRPGSRLNGLKSKCISSLYEALFKESFNAHDAKDDVQALARILTELKLDPKGEAPISQAISCTKFKQNMDMIPAAKARKSTLQNLPVSDGMKEKKRAWISRPYRPSTVTEGQEEFCAY